MFSGSSGNATIIETTKTKVLVDIGISYKKLSESLRKFDIRCDDICRVYITHAHSDHAYGLTGFLKNHQIDVYTREATKKVLISKYPQLNKFEKNIKTLNGTKEDVVSDLVVRYCRLPHQGKNTKSDDTGEHIGFVFEAYGHRMSFMTDLGHLTENMKIFHRSNDVYFIEANYDYDLQLSSARPSFLKDRIIGKYGHLSNSQTAEYLYELVDKNKTKHIFLAHLSRDCNTTELAVGTVKKKLFNHLVANKIEIYTDQHKRYFINAS